MSEPDAQVYQTRHGPMWAFRSDRYITRSLELYGEFSGREQRLFEQIVKPGMTVVEVGANIGAHTVPLARLCAPGPLHAFEPQRRVFQLLCANLVANGVANVQAWPDALAAEPGWALMPAPDYSQPNNFGGVSVVRSEAQPGARAARVRLATLDSLELPECHFLKIDVEGFEAEVLRGARETLARCRPVLYVENDREDRQAELISLIDELGYVQYWHSPPLFDPDNPNGVTDNAFGDVVSLNLLCVPKEQPHKPPRPAIDVAAWRAHPRPLADLMQPGFQAMAAGDYAEAEAVFRRVCAERPDEHQAQHALGALLSTLRRTEEADDVLRTALTLSPDNPETQLALSLNCLLLGRWDEGWALYENRHRTRQGVPKPQHAAPEWRGEDLAGKRLHVLTDEGLGDQLQYVRAVPHLLDLGAEVTVICAAPLQRLFAANLACEVHAATGRLALPDPDYWVLFGDLLPRSGLRAETAPAPPYLRPLGDPAAPKGARIGLMSTGNPKHANNAQRSLPEAMARKLLELPGVISLAPEDTGAKDFAETAAIVAGLDLVISVDTSVAHLAGAMGRPLWVLLPYMGLDWRWGLEGGSTPWYPQARLFRQPTIQAWPAVYQEVMQALLDEGFLARSPQNSG